jgi:SAM-dependent methyltransferase/uncharacterized protein YbaR (Trm112 family)
MGSYTRYTRRWLEERYRQTTPDGLYFAHQPIYGRGRPGYSEKGDIWRRARTFQVIRELNRIRFETLLDVGAAEGLAAHLVRKLFGAGVVATDLSVEACRRAWDLFGLDGVACDCSRLPFANGAFDVVVCSEMIEHVEYPCEVMLELRRVARRALIVTTDECRASRELVAAHEVSIIPHAERNLFHPDDFVTMFGADVKLEAQFKGQPPSEDVSDADATAWILSSLSDPTLDDVVGAIATLVIDPQARREPALSEAAIVAEILRPQAEFRPIAARPPRGPLKIQGLACPACHGVLERGPDTLTCRRCARAFPVVSGVPVLHVASEAEPTRDSFRARLEELWPGQPHRIEEALALRRRLEPVPASSPLRWDFGRDADSVRAWSLGADLTLRASSPEGLDLRVTGGDPSMTSPIMVFPRTGVRSVTIAMAFASDDGSDATGQIYFMSTLEPSFSEERSLTFPVKGDGRFVEHRLVVDAPPLGTDAELIVLRFDPVDRRGALTIRSFSVDSGLADAETAR